MADAKAGNAWRPVLDTTGRHRARAEADELAGLRGTARFWLKRSLEVARRPDSGFLRSQARVALALLATASAVEPTAAAVMQLTRPLS